MTENAIWFAVTSEDPPKLSDAFYDVKEIALKQMALPTDYTQNWFVDYLEKWGLKGLVKYYVATTGDSQLEALRELYEQYDVDLIFYGFTVLDTDFSEYGLSRVPR